jgi:hypothetical protein
MDNRRFRCCEQVFAISELVIWKWVGQPVRAARQMGRCAARPPCPLTASSAPERGITRTRSPGPAARHALSRGLASQRRVPTGRPLTCGVTSWRAMICRIYARYVTPFHAGMPPVSGRGPWRFRPGGAARFPGVPRRFPPGRRGVSAGVPWRFRRTAGSGCRAFPAPVVPAATAPEPAVGLFPGCDPFPGAAVRDGTDPAVRPPAVSR